MKTGDVSNNFDFLRLFAAYLVLISHQYAATARNEPLLAFFTLGGVGVLIFFTISGYLVARSWERDPSAWRFLAKRILRLWPALVVVVLLTALVLGPLVSTLPPEEYLRHPETWRYFTALRLQINFNLPGVFIDNPMSPSVNGSLWTLPIEFKCYLILLALGIVGLLRHRNLVLILTVACAFFVFGVHDAQHNPQRRFDYEFGAFFCYGMCLSCFREVWSKRPLAMLAVAGVIAVGLVAVKREYAALFVALPILAIIVGEASTPFVRRAGRFGDISYGVYIFAYPVQQTLVYLSGNRLSFWAALIASTLITVALAFLSWHFVEGPALELKRYLGKPAEIGPYPTMVDPSA